MGLLLLAPVTARAAPAPGGEAQAVILSQVELVNTGDLNFGSFASGPTAGTVVINQNNGARAVTGGVTAMGGTISRTTFTGQASRLSIVFIRSPQTPVTLTRVGGTETMLVTALRLQGFPFRIVGAGQSFNFAMGGTLAVGANQAEGAYQGTFDVTVDYF